MQLQIFPVKMRALNSCPFAIKRIGSTLIISVINNGFTYVATSTSNTWRLEKYWPDGGKVPDVLTFESIEDLALSAPCFVVLPLLLKLGCYQNKTPTA